MIHIEKLIVEPSKVDKILIRWTFTPTLESFTNYTFELQRSLSPEDEFKTIFQFVDAVQFLDDINYRRLSKNIYYRIVARNIQTSKLETTANSTFGYEPNLEALEIIRRNDILLKNKRHGVGIPVIVMIRKRDGIVCDCWDADKKRLRVSNCDECFGTHYRDGFHPPIVTWANFTPDLKSTPIAQYGETEPNDKKIFVSNYPILLPKDVIIDPSIMNTWIVDNVEVSARRGHTLHQLLTLSFVDRNSVLYKLVDKFPDMLDKVKVNKSKIELS